MKKVKVSELSIKALNWAVARIEGDTLPKDGGQGFDYSTDWAVGGPIIEKNEIELKPIEENLWVAANIFDDLERHEFTGQTPLIAAMRCHVAYKLGETVSIPEGLL